MANTNSTERVDRLIVGMFISCSVSDRLSYCIRTSSEISWTISQKYLTCWWKKSSQPFDRYSLFQYLHCFCSMFWTLQVEHQHQKFHEVSLPSLKFEPPLPTFLTPPNSRIFGFQVPSEPMWIQFLRFQSCWWILAKTQFLYTELSRKQPCCKLFARLTWSHATFVWSWHLRCHLSQWHQPKECILMGKSLKLPYMCIVWFPYR